MASKTLLSTLRAELEEERDVIRRQLGPGGDASLPFDDNFADSGQVAAEQGEARLVANSLRSQLKEIERALDKIDRGTYGVCEQCGEPIAEPRLEAMPTTRFCIHHA
ncbi:MAG: TraR/DksA family transcriptional regulator [Acidimicrobiales bacterium]